ncbi:MAG: flagellar hook-length control protein FliK [Armatimonadetes bacterium]|nr:flagellar hook-length control protein FliK [Armatimonadota bacterium]
MSDSIISSLVERSAQEEKKKPGTQVGKSSDKGFAKILEEKTATEDKTQSLDRSKKQQEKEKEQVRGELQKQLSGKTGELSPLHKFLYFLCYKDPSSLSLSEKKMLGLSETTPGNVGYQEFQKMLKERGLQLGELSWKDLSAMAKLETREELERFLDSLKGRRDHFDKRGKGDAGELMSRNLQLIARDAKIGGQPLFVGTSVPVEDKAKTTDLRQDIIDQILHRIEWRNLDKGSEAFIQMNPEFLGPLNVRMIVEKDKVVASFKAGSARVRETIEENLDELKSALAQQGFETTEIQVGKL